MVRRVLMSWTMSGCFVGPYVAPSYDTPVDCAIEIYQRAGELPPDGPRASVFRNGIEVTVTGTVENLGQVDLGLAIATVDCDGNVLSTSHQSQLYDHYRFTLSGAQPGEPLWIDGSLSGTVQSPVNGGCPAPMPTPEPVCSGNYYPCPYEGADGGIDPGGQSTAPEDDTGCNAGGASSGLIVAFALLAVRRRRAR